MENNGGGRVIKYKNNIFISTGFCPNINSGIFEYSQNIQSSFGKIIKFLNKITPIAQKYIRLDTETRKDYLYQISLIKYIQQNMDHKVVMS